MTEFALVFPIMMILLVAVADFGRVFAAGVVIEAAARNAAEAAALEYARNPPGDATMSAEQRLSNPAPQSGDAFYSLAYYQDLHMKSARAACAESRGLPNATFNDADGTCSTWPLIRVCVHDGVTLNDCGNVIAGYSAANPAECPEIPPPGDPAWSSTQLGGTRRWVEVRLCYPFTTILDLPLMPLPDVNIQRTRAFSVPCFLDPATSSC